MTLRLVCLSDTHGLHDRIDVPDGDLLLHAGDFTKRGRESEVEDFARFLERLPHRHKIVVAGNHDFLFERDAERARELLANVTYLEDSGVSVEGLAVWGSPWQPWFHDWAFNLPRGAALAERWEQIPPSTDVLITHGPAHGLLDVTVRGQRVGCEELTRALERVRPGLHVCGHIHEGYGHVHRDETLCVNASNCDFGYQPVQPPIVVEWDADGPRLANG